MKATIDIPDDLYRSVKARSALEGRALRSVAVELFQKWLSSSPAPPEMQADSPSESTLARYPWLAISAKYVRPGISDAMDDIRDSIARGWAAETSGRFQGGAPSR